MVRRGSIVVACRMQFTMATNRRARGMRGAGTITQTSSRLWRLRVPLDGRQVTYGTYATEREAADEFVRACQAQSADAAVALVVNGLVVAHHDVSAVDQMGDVAMKKGSVRIIAVCAPKSTPCERRTRDLPNMVMCRPI